MTPKNLPKIPGLQAVSWTNKDGTTATRYRVRIQKNGRKENRLFEDYEEAKEFILLFKSKLGREKIFSITEKEKQEQAFFKDILQAPILSLLFKKYLEDYHKITEHDTHNTRRIKQNIKSFFNSIANTEIPEPSELKAFVFERYIQSPKKKFGALKPEQLSHKAIEDYIKARRDKGIKGISIERELTILSNFFKALKKTQQYKDLPNFAIDFDKSLLTQYKREDNKSKTRKKAMTEAELEEYFKALSKAQNPDIKLIALLSLATAMRRSEIIDLTWEQVDFNDNVIYLPTTKAGYPREVVLTNEAKQILESINRQRKGKVFSYKNYSSFEGSYKRVLERAKLKGYNFHKLRAEAFTRFFNNLGNGSETMLAQFLGVRNISTFITNHKPKTYKLNTEQDIIKSGGHKSTQITFNSYLLDIIKKK